MTKTETTGKLNHTPGPWAYDWQSKTDAPTMFDDEPEVWPIVIHVDGGPAAGSQIALIEHDRDAGDPEDCHSDESIATARLIAAAPEMLELLKGLADNFHGVALEPVLSLLARLERG